ncbi:fumarylacetoacetate hydrolase family protein [Bradyrhizobium commune]|uniref:Fumarylacetoacetate hydrolase family protein n=1 Tax=Bradyrhizobium commune TaxID=83627 RepID=A0A7S9D3X7_9BRAD|nr:fumarylacetoacetate hydrolase family protein [Bradyrhizobium commune]QPF90696.1 fumarylacetoacetate hydrolase family protein [Bradyrhizobium commune]
MKLVRVATCYGEEKSCIWKGEDLFVLRDAQSIVDVLAMSAEERASLETRLSAGPSLKLADVKLLAPIQPTSLKDFMGFEVHFLGALKWMFPDGGGPGGAGTGKLPERLYSHPMFYVCDNSALLGPSDDVIIPPNSSYYDCEVELAAVMARGGRDMTPAQAGEAIGGYTIFLDWSARDVLRHDTLAPTKGKDSGNTLGPCIVTKSEIEKYRVGDRLKVPMKLARNGELIGEGDTEHSIYSIEEMIAYVSRGATIKVGDVIAMGTAPNLCWVEQWGHNGEIRPSPIKGGDTVSMEVAGIGSMSIQVREGSPYVELPPARRYMPSA